MYVDLEQVDWENRAEWHLIADKLEELASAIETSDITALDNNGIRNINIIRRLIDNTQALADYYRQISDNIVSK